MREAQAAGTLSHPNIVTIHDVGEEVETQTSFIAMEYVEGKNLKQLLKDKVAFSWDRDRRDRDVRRGRPRLRPPPRDRPPRRQAREHHHPHDRRNREDHGLRDREDRDVEPHGDRPVPRDAELHVARAGDGRGRGRAERPLLARRRPVRAPHEEEAVPRRQPDVDLVQDRPRGVPAAADVRRDDPGGVRIRSWRGLSRRTRRRGSRAARTSSPALAEFRTRHAEMEMLKDLGEMVAQAENLGPVSAVESKESPARRRLGAACPRGPLEAARPASGILGGGTTTSRTSRGAGEATSTPRSSARARRRISRARSRTGASTRTPLKPHRRTGRREEEGPRAPGLRLRRARSSRTYSAA